MSGRLTQLYSQNDHHCVLFTGMVSGEGIESNQFLIVHEGRAALFDPGGDLTYTPLSIELSRHIRLHDLDYVVASHQDPDVIASLPRWLMNTRCRVVVSELWNRFLPHLVSDFVDKRLAGNLSSRLISLPDAGGEIELGSCRLKAIPAHFLHSVGNFHFYDPISKFLFTGDVGAAVECGDDHVPVENFNEHVEYMADFHHRYMAGNRACRAWVERVRKLDVAALVPQHGKPFIGKPMVEQFLKWFERLECGTDRLQIGAAEPFNLSR